MELESGMKFDSKIPGLTVEVVSFKDPGNGSYKILNVKALNDGLDVKKDEILEFVGTEGFFKRYKLNEN